MNDDLKHPLPANTPWATAVLPTWSLSTVQHPKKPSGYVPAVSTDVRKTWAKARKHIEQLATETA